MRSICSHCGDSKSLPQDKCSKCKFKPAEGYDIATAFYLSELVSDSTFLKVAALHIRDGQIVEIPESKFQHVIDVIKSGKAQRLEEIRDAKLSQKGCLVMLGIASLIIAVLYLFFAPGPHYKWASFKDTSASYESFLERFPRSSSSGDAIERLRILSQDDVWSKANQSGSIKLLREYRDNYPDGNYLVEANTQIRMLADNYWKEIEASRSEKEIKGFIRNYPETTKLSRAEKRLQELYNDWGWVRSEDNLLSYRRFLEANPSHPQKNWIDKRIIDLEVKEIASGDYGSMPPAQALNLGGVSAKIEVENQTGYTLTVRYSGPDSQKLIIPVGATKSISLPPGDYQVAASVDASRVRNYYGTDTIRGGTYSSSFYIQTEYGGLSFPSSTPRRRKR